MPSRANSNQIKPREWQIQLVNLLKRRVISSLEKDILVHAGPGAGKTIGALLGFNALRNEFYLEKFLVFCHRGSIANQWYEASKKLKLKSIIVDISKLKNLNRNSFDGLIFTYQGCSKNLKEIKDELNLLNWTKTLSIADEVHHLGLDPEEPEGAIWGKNFINLTKKSALRIGLTGTPFRADNLAFCSGRKIIIQEKDQVTEQITPDICIEPKDLISAGDVRPLEFHFQDGSVEYRKEGNHEKEKSNISEEVRTSWRASNLRKAISLKEESGIALQLLLRTKNKLDQIRLFQKNAAGLVIARDIEHAESISKFLIQSGDQVELVHSQQKDAGKRLSAFQENSKNWLVSIDMCSEGFDAPRIRVVAYLTCVVTKSRFIQAITRSVRIGTTNITKESIPRRPSYVFAPADPLLMEYAKNWSTTQPYLIRNNQVLTEPKNHSWIPKGPTLPMEAVNEEIGKIIKMRTTQLPNFLH